MKFVFFNKRTMELIEGPVEMSDCQTPEQAINTRYGSGLRDHIGCEMQPTQQELEQHRRQVRAEIEDAQAMGPDASLTEDDLTQTFSPIDGKVHDFDDLTTKGGDQDDRQAEGRLGGAAPEGDRDGQEHHDGEVPGEAVGPEVQGRGPGEHEEVRDGDAEVQDGLLGAS